MYVVIYVAYESSEIFGVVVKFVWKVGEEVVWMMQVVVVVVQTMVGFVMPLDVRNGVKWRRKMEHNGGESGD